MAGSPLEDEMIKVVFCFSREFKCPEDEFSALLLEKKVFFQFGRKSIVHSKKPIEHEGYTLLISSVDVLIPDVTKEILERAVNEKVNTVLAPCYNFSPDPSQVQSANPYITLEGFEKEARDIWEREGFRLNQTKKGNKDILFFHSKLARGFPSYRAFIEEMKTLYTVKGWYAHKYGEGGFNSPREDLLELVPSGIYSVLDVGAGGGGFGRALKKALPNIKIFAVEPNKAFASMCQGIYEKVFSTSFEELVVDELFDMVVMGDVLEHMYNPWRALKKVKYLLKPKGVLLLSVPIVNHWSILKSLEKGFFSYTPWGPLSFTHIRFFTERSILELLEFSGFEVDRVVRKELLSEDSDMKGSSTYAIIIRAVASEY